MSKEATARSAMKLALEALELHGKQYPHMVKGYCLDAITALREALAIEAIEKPAPGRAHYEDGDVFERIAAMKKQPAQQESVGYVAENGVVDWNGCAPPILTDLYTSPQRTWVGLTEQEFQWIYDHGRTPAGMMELVEAKLRSKNEDRN